MRRAVGVIGAGILVIALVGCGRFDRHEAPVVIPTPTVASESAESAESSEELDALLESVDATLDDATEALDAAEEAIAQE